MSEASRTRNAIALFLLATASFVLSLGVMSEARGAEREPDEPRVDGFRSEKRSRRKSPPKFFGRIGLGRDFIDSRRPEDQFELRLGMETRRVNRFKAIVEVRGGEGSRNVRMHDVFVDYRSRSKRNRVRFGRGKKTLGWEYHDSTAERLTIQRSLGYQYLAERSLVGRDYFVSYDFLQSRSDPDEKEDGNGKGSGNGYGYWNPATPRIDPAEAFRTGISIHTDESRNFSAIVNGVLTLSDRARLGSWLIAQSNRTPTGSLSTWGGMISGNYEPRQHRFSIEGFAGTDPFRTLLERDYGAGRKVTLAVIRGEYGLSLGRWRPYFVPTLLLKDLSKREDRITEETLGLRYFVIPELNIAIEWTGRRHRAPDPAMTTFNRRIISVMARYFF